MDVRRAIELFLKGDEKDLGEDPNGGYASFDYCYNYFYSFYKENKIEEMANDENLQLSCLQLGFYLASWGMMRGSSFLLRRSAKNYKDLINTISKMDRKLWEIDADNYNDENIEILLDCKKQIIKALGEENNPSDTLITKIMLGVFANIPAFDQYVRKSFKFHPVNKKNLLKIKEFYEKNKTILDSYKIHTFDFLTSKKTNTTYTKAKLIDMYAFIDGLQQS